MHYVYLLQSLSHLDQFYTGLTSDVQARLAAHNAGQSPHTSKFKPWKLLSTHWIATPGQPLLSNVISRAVPAAPLR